MAPGATEMCEETGLWLGRIHKTSDGGSNFDGHELWVEHGPFKIWGYFRKTHLNLSYSPKKDS